jgi:hypothetical protein
MNNEIEGLLVVDDLRNMQADQLSPKTIYCLEINLLGAVTIFRFDLFRIEFSGLFSELEQYVYLHGWKWVENSRKENCTLPYHKSKVSNCWFFLTKEDAMKYSFILVMQGHKPPKIIDLPPPPKKIKNINPKEYYDNNPTKGRKGKNETKP